MENTFNIGAQMKFLILSLLFTSFASAASNVEVKMKSLSFDPKQVEISEGQSVFWKNTAYTDHSATSDDTPAVFDTKMVSPGESSKPILFKNAGTFKYHCSLHGKTMSGVVIVKANAK